MQKAMTIAYAVGKNLYLNITNRCPCACTPADELELGRLSDAGR